MTEKKEQLTDEDFFSKYTCEYNQIKQRELAAQEDNGRTTIADMTPYEGRMYETFDEEYARVKEVLDSNPRRIWTLIDNNDGWTGICAGWHYVNRMGYFITEEEYQNENEEYTCYDTTELREQWDKLPMEAILEIGDVQEDEIESMEPEDIRDEYFYCWEELDEETRDNTLAKYNIL